MNTIEQLSYILPYTENIHKLQSCVYHKHQESRLMYLSNRVATAQGKRGIWLLTFPDRENAGNFVNLIFTQGKLWQHRKNFEKLEFFENFVI